MMTPWLSCGASWLAFTRVVLDVMQWLQLALLAFMFCFISV